jgi:hypothetical protein
MFPSLKFFSIKDIIFSIVPTLGSYEGYVKGLIPETIFPNKYMIIAAGVLISLLFIVIFYIDNKRNYQKSLSEVLATGYFANFTGPLSKVLSARSAVKFAFPDGAESSIEPGKIKVEVGMPLSLASLIAYADKVKAESEIVYIREITGTEPYWVRARKDEDGSLTIFEFPRTLFALSYYLDEDFSDKTKAEKISKRLYRYFDNRIQNLRIVNSDKIPADRLQFRPV